MMRRSIKTITKPSTMQVNDLSIDIHVLGPGYGEAVILVIGKRIVIGVNSCLSLINQDLDGFTYLDNLLRTALPNPFVVWTLTHFHHDHFEGLAWILRQHASQICLLVVPENYTTEDIASNIRRNARSDSGTVGMYHAASGEYERLMQVCSDARIRAIKVKAAPSYRAIDLDLRTRTGISRRLVVDVIGAPVDDLDSLIAIQTPKALDASRRKNRSTANLGSYIVAVRLGDFRAVLLGDAPAGGTQCLPWKNILKNCSVSFVKVAHHGATDGTSDYLVQLLTSGMEAEHPKVAVVTPFRKQGLPRRATLELFGKRGFEVRRSGSRGDSIVGELIEQEFGIDGALHVESALSPKGEVALTSFRCRQGTAPR